MQHRLEEGVPQLQVVREPTAPYTDTGYRKVLAEVRGELEGIREGLRGVQTGGWRPLPPPEGHVAPRIMSARLPRSAPATPRRR